MKHIQVRDLFQDQGSPLTPVQSTFTKTTTSSKSSVVADKVNKNLDKLITGTYP